MTFRNNKDDVKAKLVRNANLMRNADILRSDD